MSIPLSTLSTRAGVLMYPSEAAQVLEDNPPFDEVSSMEGSPEPINNEVLATRAGCLLYPGIAAEYIAEIAASSSTP